MRVRPVHHIKRVLFAGAFFAVWCVTLAAWIEVALRHRFGKAKRFKFSRMHLVCRPGSLICALAGERKAGLIPPRT